MSSEPKNTDDNADDTVDHSDDTTATRTEPDAGGPIPNAVEEPEASTEDRVRSFVDESRRANRAVTGSLTLNYRSRDVTVCIDGALAMQLIATWRKRSDCRRSMHSEFSSAHFGWIGIDLDEVMGLLWEPALDRIDDAAAARVGEVRI